MKKYVIAFTLLLFAFQMNAQEAPTSDIQWMSFEEAVELNKKDPKPLLISVYATWCGWCKRMDATTYQNTVITEYINKNFHPVKLNGEEPKDITFNDYTFKFKQQGRTKYNEFAAAILNGKLSYPTTVIMNEQLQLLDRVPGYLDSPMMEKVAAFFATEKYKSVNWQDFVKDFKSNL